MITVLLIIHLLVAAALVAVILMQRSEGGALGVGGGPGGMMSGRGAANLLTRTTMILGGVFVANSILLAVVTGVTSGGQSVFDSERATPGMTREDVLGDAFSDLPTSEEGQPGLESSGADEADAPTLPQTDATTTGFGTEDETPAQPQVPGR